MTSRNGPAGRLIAFVGPSGVGKDSVMRAVADADPVLGLARRVITRPPGAGEDFESVDEEEFERRLDAGEFCLSWRAHGLGYGIPAAVKTEVATGAQRLVNLSRSVLAEADARFPTFSVIELRASPETLARRLAGRGRETADDIAERLAREGSKIPAGLDHHPIANDGPLVETVAKVRQALGAPVRA